MPRVVLLGLDGFPLRYISESTTPTLWRLATDGGGPLLTGTCALPSTTYPSFTSLLTGVPPARHGVWVTGPRPGAPAWGAAQQVSVPTLLDRTSEAGLRTVAVLGDHHLASVLRIRPSILAWPPDIRPPDGTQLDAHGYATNAAVRPHLLAAAADGAIDLLFGHLNEADTIGHDLGPGALAVRDVAVATDALIADVLDALAHEWSRTVLIITSDHDMERVAEEPIIDLLPGPLDGVAEGLVADGGAAIIRPLPDRSDALLAVLRTLAGVQSVEREAGGLVVVGAAPGRIFGGTPLRPYLGVHGGPSTARTLAIVAGGAPEADALCRHGGVIPGVAWVPMLARLFGLR